MRGIDVGYARSDGYWNILRIMAEPEKPYETREQRKGVRNQPAINFRNAYPSITTFVASETGRSA
jgi:hypothetical protein